MKDRLTFLYFLFEVTNLKDVAEVRLYNDGYDLSRIIGINARARKEYLSVIYNQYITTLPIETPVKKKSNFKMKKI